VLALLIILLAAFLVFPLISDSGKKPPRTAASEPAPPQKPLPTALSPGTIAASPPAGETEPRFKPYSAYDSTSESSNS